MIEGEIAFASQLLGSEYIQKAQYDGYLTSKERDIFLLASERFLSDIQRQYPPKDYQKIIQAYSLMTTLHLHQHPRADGAFIFHPLRAANELLHGLNHPDADLVAAELLHDSAEDQRGTLRDLWRVENRRSFLRDDRAFSYLKATFGRKVGNLVKKVSHMNFDTQGNYSDDEFTREIIPAFQEYMERVVEDGDAFVVKIFDLMQNIRLTLSLAHNDPHTQRYYDLYGSILPAVIKRLGEPGVNINEATRRILRRELFQAEEIMTRRYLSI